MRLSAIYSGFTGIHSKMVNSLYKTRILKVYFASDFHLGIDGDRPAQQRERLVVEWLEMAGKDADAIYLLGDLFDFWFEYQKAVPRGHIRFLGTLAKLKDSGVQIEIFTGNHDMWMFDYLEEELNLRIHRAPIRRKLAGREFLMGHGDGLGPGDFGYKRLKRVFAHPFAQWLFARLHPNLGIRIAEYWSGTSRAQNYRDETFLGPEGEWLIQYCEYLIAEGDTADYYIFGHRHLTIDYRLSNGSRYLNLGEWMSARSYAVFDGADVKIQHYKNEKGRIIK
jgi:UDP-2,3-diacylglucosamine hydrolase